MAGFKIKGFAQLLRKVALLKRDSARLFKRDEIDEVSAVFKESQSLVRRKSGRLAQSGRITGNANSTFIRYGGISVRGSAPIHYAKIVASRFGHWVNVDEARLVRRLKRRRKSIVAKFNKGKLF